MTRKVDLYFNLHFSVFRTFQLTVGMERVCEEEGHATSLAKGVEGLR